MKYWTMPMGGLYLKGRLKQPPRVTEYRVGAPLRFVFVSDVHMSESFPLASVAALVDQVIALKPDALLLGGDYAETDSGARDFFRELARIRVPMFAIAGNNDDPRFDMDRDAYRALMLENGVTPLYNQMARLRAQDGRYVEIAGVEDMYEGAPDATGLFSGDPGAYRVLLSHAPHTFLLRQCAPAPQLMLCGHTHGGQLNALGFTCYSLVGYEHYFQFTHIAGEKRVGDTRVIVSRGVGVSKYAMRMGACPEILLIR